jgi:hypothetical protein
MNNDRCSAGLRPVAWIQFGGFGSWALGMSKLSISPTPTTTTTTTTKLAAIHNA